MYEYAQTVWNYFLHACVWHRVITAFIMVLSFKVLFWRFRYNLIGASLCLCLTLQRINVFQNIIDRFHSLHLAWMIDSFWKVTHLVAMETWRTLKRSLSAVFWCRTGLLSPFAIYQLLMAAASTAVQFEQPVPDAKLFIPQFRSIMAVVSVIVMWFLSVSMFVTQAEFLVYLVVKVHDHVL